MNLCAHEKENDHAITCADCSVIGIDHDELWACPGCDKLRLFCHEHYGACEACGLCGVCKPQNNSEYSSQCKSCSSIREYGE